MGKKTANNAIDFTRLFAMKDQLARREELEDVRDPSVVLTAVTAEAPAEAPIAELRAAAPAIEAVTIHEPTARTQMAAANSTQALAEMAGVASPPSATVRPLAADASPTFLRIGMSRDLHERVRAFAAVQGQPPTVLVRDLFERVTPVFDASAPMASLAACARGVVPAVVRERRVDMRMQIPVSDDLHRRMQQFAALRAQTLGASMLDVLEAHAPPL